MLKKQDISRHIIQILLLLIIPISVTYPVIFHLESYILTSKYNTHATVWNLKLHKDVNDYLKDVLLSNNYSLFERVQKLYFSTINLKLENCADIMFFSPIYSILPLQAYYNLVAILVIFFNGISFYFMANYFVKDRMLSFAGAGIFASAPYTNICIKSGHIIHASQWWLPLFILFLFKTRDEKSFFNSIILGILYGVICIFNWFYGFLISILIIIFALSVLLFKWSLLNKQFILRYIIAGLIAGILVLLNIIPFFLNRDVFYNKITNKFMDEMKIDLHTEEGRAIGPKSHFYLYPLARKEKLVALDFTYPFDTCLGYFINKTVDYDDVTVSEPLKYGFFNRPYQLQDPYWKIPIYLTILAILPLFFAFKERIFWLLSMFVFYIITLGRMLRHGGWIIGYGNKPVLLPVYYLYKHFPFYHNFHYSERAYALMILFLSMLVVFCFSSLKKYRFYSEFKYIFSSLIFPVMFLYYYSNGLLPIALVKYSAPGFYKVLAKSNMGELINIPIVEEAEYDYRHEYYFQFHKKFPILKRVEADFLESQIKRKDFIFELLLPEKVIIQDSDQIEIVEKIKQHLVEQSQSIDHPIYILISEKDCTDFFNLIMTKAVTSAELFSKLLEKCEKNFGPAVYIHTDKDDHNYKTFTFQFIPEGMRIDVTGENKFMSSWKLYRISR